MRYSFCSLNLIYRGMESVVRTELLLLINDRVLFDVAPDRYPHYDNSHACQLSRKMMRLVRYESSLLQEEDGVIALRHSVPRFNS